MLKRIMRKLNVYKFIDILASTSWNDLYKEKKCSFCISKFYEND